MKTTSFNLTVLALLAGASALPAQTDLSVRRLAATEGEGSYVNADPNQTFAAVSDIWLADTLQILTGSDHGTDAISIGGHTGVKVTGNNLNIADTVFDEWADDDVIDILVQAYGDAALFAANGNPRNFNFLTGTLPELAAPVGGSIPVEAKNKKWNWVLFRITNGIRPSDGSHFVGSIPANAQGGFQYGASTAGPSGCKITRV